jgi:hypothetical protein
MKKIITIGFCMTFVLLFLSEIQAQNTTNKRAKKLKERTATIIIEETETANNKQKKSPIYILDGKEVASEKINEINPNDIESVSILKNLEAMKTYGDKGKNGVILIKMKDKKK